MEKRVRIPTPAREVKTVLPASCSSLTPLQHPLPYQKT